MSDEIIESSAKDPQIYSVLLTEEVFIAVIVEETRKKAFSILADNYATNKGLIRDSHLHPLQ